MIQYHYCTEFKGELENSLEVSNYLDSESDLRIEVVDTDGEGLSVYLSREECLHLIKHISQVLEEEPE
ncbi:TPA: hypothetical protein QCO88_001670 [Bacillus cereus]|uniref:hypothetical protein n=1 Tax=Bacillus TaxID=1386 RepID=UPI00192D5A35|nr:hypothetical protein [Bacillus cereus]HDR3899165.1 hypothetical protein [Bacillus cereus]